jgi:D-lactate dehydrogenase
LVLLAPDVTRIAPDAPQPAADRAPDWVAAGTPDPLRAGLVALLGPDRVLTRALDIVSYASDASPYRLFPQAVAMPRDVDDIVRLFGFAHRAGTPLVFRAGGTSLNGQSQTAGILVDVRRHWQRVRVHDEGARVRVQPGIASTARGMRAGAIGPGVVAARIARHTRVLGPGLWFGARLRGGAHYVYGVHRGRIRFIALASATEAASTQPERSPGRRHGVSR